MTPETIENYRILTQDELDEMYPYRAAVEHPEPEVGPTYPVHVVLMLVAICVTLPLAMYGAVKLGGDVVRMMLGVG